MICIQDLIGRYRASAAMRGPRCAWLATLALGGALVATLAGCAVGNTQPEAFEPELPAQWQATVVEEAEPVSASWWLAFGSAQLAQLLEQAERGSPDLAAAAERVRQAEGQLRISGASLFPALNLSASTAWRRSDPPDGTAFDSETTSLGLGASYELDVWGRLGAERRGAAAGLAASEYDFAAVRLSLQAGIASGYFQWLALQEREVMARQNLAIAERVMGIVEARYRHGVASGLDLARQQGTVLAQRAALLSLQEQRLQTRGVLAILLGQAPQHFALVGEDFAALQVPVVVAGLPSELLLRRPDLARAEAQLQGAEANLTAARAALLPSISLAGTAGLASNALLSLNPATSSVGFSAALLQSLFDGGRRQGQITISASRQRELVANYQRTILVALNEVEDGLNRINYAREQQRLQEQIVAQAQRSLQLAEMRYREGAEELLGVLDAQRGLFLAEEQRVQLQLARLNAALELFKLLGGGWSVKG